MAKRQSIHLEGFSHTNPVPAAARIGNVMASGVLVGRDPASKELPATLDAQLGNVFHHARELMAAAGGSLDDVLKMTFWMVDYRDRDDLNRHWVEAFPDPEHRPARQVMPAQLDRGVLVMADVLAVLPDATVS